MPSRRSLRGEWKAFHDLGDVLTTMEKYQVAGYPQAFLKAKIKTLHKYMGARTENIGNETLSLLDELFVDRNAPFCIRTANGGRVPLKEAGVKEANYSLLLGVAQHAPKGTPFSVLAMAVIEREKAVLRELRLGGMIETCGGGAGPLADLLRVNKQMIAPRRKTSPSSNCSAFPKAGLGGA